MSQHRNTTSDPERIRALTHPIRLELLDFLKDTDEATATECAAQVGESVASCSFHLRMLEKYGYIERAERRGREKPWRVVRAATTFDARPDATVPGSLFAVQELASLAVTREADRVSRFLAQAGNEPDEWIQGSTVTTGSFWVTSDELAALSSEVQSLLDRFQERTDPANRPAGARRVRLFATLNPDPDTGPPNNADTGPEH